MTLTIDYLRFEFTSWQDLVDKTTDEDLIVCHHLLSSHSKTAKSNVVSISNRGNDNLFITVGNMFSFDVKPIGFTVYVNGNTNNPFLSKEYNNDN